MSIGELNIHEILLLRFLKHWKDVDPEEELLEAFQALEAKGKKGVISGAELKHMLWHIGEKLTEEEAADFMRRIGKDETSELPHEAIIKILLKKFG